jgi:hypothetical protein
VRVSLAMLRAFVKCSPVNVRVNHPVHGLCSSQHCEIISDSSPSLVTAGVYTLDLGKQLW